MEKTPRPSSRAGTGVESRARSRLDLNGREASGRAPADPGLRRTFYVTAALLFAAGLVAFVFSESTDVHFAWTIEPATTAAFIGAGYWTSVFIVLLAARERTWAEARIAFPAPMAFATSSRLFSD